MWLKTPPKPVDALITFLMSLVCVCFIMLIKISLIKYYSFDYILQGRHLVLHSGSLHFVDMVLAFLFSLLLFIGGLLKLVGIANVEKKQFFNIMRWNYKLVLGLSCFFILEMFWILIRYLKYYR